MLCFHRFIDDFLCPYLVQRPAVPSKWKLLHPKLE